MKLSFAISLQPTVFKAISFGDWRKQIALLSSFGYNGVELAVREPSKIDNVQLQKTLEENNLKVSAIGTGQVFLEEGLSLSDKDSMIRKRAVTRIKDHINLAALLNTQVIIGLIRGNNINEIGIKKVEFLKESFKRICEYAAQYNTMITIEPLNRYETCFLNTVDETIEFINQIGYKGLKVLLDTFHMNIEEKNMCESIEKAKEYVAHFHFADSNRKCPGAGHIDYKKIIKKIKEIKYDKFISAEILPSPDFITSLKEFIQFMKKREE